MTDAELIELFTYIAHLKDENKYLKEQNQRLLDILKRNGFEHSATTFVPAGPPTLPSKLYFGLEERRKNERIQ